MNGRLSAIIIYAKEERKLQTVINILVVRQKAFSSTVSAVWFSQRALTRAAILYTLIEAAALHVG